MLHVNFTDLCFIERELLSIEVLDCGNRDFGPFVLLDLDPMTVYELDPYPLEIYRMWANKTLTSRLSKVTV